MRPISIRGRGLPYRFKERNITFSGTLAPCRTIWCSPSPSSLHSMSVPPDTGIFYKIWMYQPCPIFQWFCCIPLGKTGTLRRNLSGPCGLEGWTLGNFFELLSCRGGNLQNPGKTHSAKWKNEWMSEWNNRYEYVLSYTRRTNFWKISTPPGDGG